MKGRVEMFSDKIPFILFFTYVSDIPKKKDSSPSKKKDQSPTKKKVSKRKFTTNLWYIPEKNIEFQTERLV
jgi:hypothetical protein